MAQPVFGMIDQAVRHFYDQWFHGFQPSLSLETKSNGVITTISSVFSFTASSVPQQLPMRQQSCKRRSGRASRHRRQNLRKSVQQEFSKQHQVVESSPTENHTDEEEVLVDEKSLEPVQDIDEPDSTTCVDSTPF